MSPIDIYDGTGQDKGCQGLTADSLRGAMGIWLETIADWDWYATLTFRDPHDPRFPNWTKIGWNSAHKALRAFNAALVHYTDTNPLWVACMELQRRGVPHWHMLVGNVAGERRLFWKDWWDERYGYARIWPYEQDKGARFYLGKYLSKRMSDIRFSPAMMAKLEREQRQKHEEQTHWERFR